ncbi:MAG: ABC transporter permease, partial [SAR202 cluster bacterium]|nr:ABC transporter permease [SAR202 cluster bacterium]
MRSLASFLWWFTRRRVASSWRLLFVSFAAVLLATTVISATLLYANTLAERGLQHALATAPQDTLNAQLVVQERPLGEKEYRKLQVAVERSVNDRLDAYLTSLARYGRTETFTVLETARNRPGVQGYTFFLTGFEDHSALTEGRWPRGFQTAQRGDGNRVLEAVVGQDLARRMRWDLGFEVALWPPGADRADAVLLKVVGIAAPRDPADPFWMGSLDLFKLIETDAGSFVPIYLPESDFFGSIGARFPAVPGDFWWRLLLDSKGLTTGSVKPVTEALDGLETDVNKSFPRSLLLTSLDSRLQEYQRQLALAQVPIFLFSALVVAVLLYYLWVVSSLLARSRGPELALLRSRGASLFQSVLLHSGSESLLVVAPAVVLGPLMSFLLVRFPLSGPLFGGDGTGVSPALSPGAFGLSALVGLLAVGVLGGAG